MRKTFLAAAAAPALLAAAMPTAALAHAGHDTGSFMSGMMHPVGGLDHVLAMVAVGLWAAQTGGRAIWAAPLALVGAMLAGGSLGMAGVGFPAVEPMILASIAILGAAVALAVRVPLAPALAVIALFGVAHGHAHGAEGPATGMAAYGLGFALATAALHGAGLALGFGLARLAGSVRLLGLGAAGAGLALAIAG